ncbi:MAG TPA: methylmalonyl-CoA mutase subunit beta [Xanthobacteraceae bacterium]|nr:methylmalonyl-CoA mutase subunit beta [Xanthobacteraceae bacterium]
MNDDLRLGSEFPPATREQWLKLVQAALKERPFESLIARSYDGLPIAPLHARAAHAQPLAGRAAGRPWTVMQRVDHPDPAAANAEARHDLENGATGLTLVCAGSINANGFGLDGSAEGLVRVLDGVPLGEILIDFNVSAETRGIVRHFAALVKRRNISPAAVRMCASLNPIGGMAAAGGSPLTWKELAPAFATLVGELAGEGFRGPFAAADGRIVHNAGGAEAQELGFTLASAVAYLRALDASGVSLDAARRMIYFRLAADADQFLTMAKFRALRKLWARIEEACGLAPQPALVFAETAWRMLTRRDPWVNILRATIAVFAAGVGGADAVTVLPHTAALGLPDRFARRIARNIQLLLLEESNIARVADPAAGSGAIEDLTERLCEAAWTLFQEIEAAGGIAAALEAGVVQQRIAAVRAERERAVARRIERLTGTSDYPDLAEAPVKVLDVPPLARAPAPAPIAIKFPALPRMRLAEPFERLRDASDRALKRTGARPKIFLANLGRPSDFNARATFAKNFFEAGGIEAVAYAPSAAGEAPNATAEARESGPAAVAAAFASSGAQLACLCSSDEVYARQAAEAARALAAAGARHIYLAGRPRDEASLRDAGIGTFIFAGCDALATLHAVHDMLGLGSERAP